MTLCAAEGKSLSISAPTPDGKLPHAYMILRCVGIRRHEYRALRCENFVVDESGYPCVEVRKGKGGKYQLQRSCPMMWNL